MGYRAWIDSYSIRIPTSKVPDCLKSVIESEGCFETAEQAVKRNVPHFEYLPPLLQLTEAVYATYGYKLIPDKNGDITKIMFEWEKYHGDELWEALAPFMDDASYIQFCGEDGAQWRQIFKNAKTKRIEPILEWPE